MHFSNYRFFNCRDRNVIVWGYNPEDDEMDCVSVLSGHTQDVKFVRFSNINNNLYSCSYDDTIRVWYFEEEDFSNINTLRAHEGTVWGLAFKSTAESRAMYHSESVQTESFTNSSIGITDDNCMEVEVSDNSENVNEFVSCGMDGRVIFWREIEGRLPLCRYKYR